MRLCFDVWGSGCAVYTLHSQLTQLSVASQRHVNGVLLPVAWKSGIQLPEDHLNGRLAITLASVSASAQRLPMDLGPDLTARF